MKALTLTQPWATLVAIGVKTIETRSWATTYRGALAIHAAKGFPKDCRDLCSEDPFAEALTLAGIKSPTDLPLGVVVATCNLRGCVQMGTDAAPCTADLMQWLKRPMYPEAVFGDYAARRWAWVLDNVVPLKMPRAAKGALGLWEWEP
jgi:hypothetical protein